MEFLKGLSPDELIRWADETCNIYLDVNAPDAALLGQLLRIGLPIE